MAGGDDDDGDRDTEPEQLSSNNEVRIGGSHPLAGRLTSDAQHLLNFAAWIGAHQEKASGQVSFLSPFIALLARRDRLARTLRRGATSVMLDPSEISGIP